MKTFEFTVTSEIEGCRLDLGVVAAGSSLSRRKVRQAIDVGGVFVNKKRVRMASRLLKVNDKVVVRFNDDAIALLKKPRSSMDRPDILFVDEDVMVVNKPPGLASQATRNQAVDHLIVWVQEGMKHLRLKGKPALVHRLDKETSGVMILGLNKQSTDFLTDQFRHRVVEKEYHSLNQGRDPQPHWVVKKPLFKPDRHGQVKVAPSDYERKAETGFEVREMLSSWAFLLVSKPITGRTHQIRVHSSWSGYPILGDKVYGDKSTSGLALAHHMLHARSLRIALKPGEKPRKFKAPYPKSFQETLIQLRSN